MSKSSQISSISTEDLLFEEDFNNELFALEFNVKNLIPRDKKLFDGIKSIIIEFRVPGMPRFSLEGKISKDGITFVEAKRVTFPNSANVWETLNIVALLPEEKVIGSCSVQLSQCLDLDNTDRDCVSACFRLKKDGVIVGSLEMTIGAFRLGDFFNEDDDAASCLSGNCRWIGPPCSPVSSSEGAPKRGSPPGSSARRDVIHFHTHEDRSIIVDWLGPVQSVKELPPYHEDVGMQTQDVRKPLIPSAKKGK